MDTLTQIALGTTIAEAYFRKSLGRKALLFGAFCGWFPDVDVFFHSPNSWDSLVSHRGVTHSVLCLPLLAPLLGEFAFRWSETGSRWQWVQLAFWALITHPLLDVCTVYGTQLLAPFSNQRFSTNAVAIIDLLYSLPLFFACGLTIFRKGIPIKTRMIAQLALGLSSMYLVFCHFISFLCLQRAENLFQQQGFVVEAIRVSPPVGLPFVRRAIARDAQGALRTTALSVFVSSSPTIHSYVPPTDPLVTQVLEQEEGQIFSWFSDGFVYVTASEERIQLTDARYGLFVRPWWSPFSASVAVQQGEIQGRLQRSLRPKGTDYQAEFIAGWNIMWTGHSAHGTDSM